MGKLPLLLSAILLLGTAGAITPQELDDARALVASGIGCSALSDTQLELIGEYYMELMHPGEAHELMHRMMGLSEGSEAEKQFHVSLARRIYCNENIGMMGYGMTWGQPGGYQDAGIAYLVSAVAVIALVYFFVKKRKN